MKFETRKKLSRILLVSGVLSTMVVLCAGCGSVDSLFTTVQAVLSGIGVVLAAVGAALAPAETAAIQEGVTIAESAVAALKTAVDDYEADTTDTTLLSKVQAAVTAVQKTLPSLLAAAQIKNATLQAWITKVVDLISTVIEDVVNDILPAVETGALTSESQVESLNTKAKSLNSALVSGYDEALASSGLPPEVVSTEHKRFHDKIARHIGPIRV